MALDQNGFMSFMDPIQKTPYVAPDWTPPTDWIDISKVADNEINLLMSDLTDATIAFAVSADFGTYQIDWGDGLVVVAYPGVIMQHTYSVGTGTACSEGYTTFKIKIWKADAVITGFKIVEHNLRLGDKVSPLLSIAFGTTGLVSLANMFHPLTGFIQYSNLEMVTFPSVMNSLTTMDYCFENCYSLKIVTMPICADNLASLAYCFVSCGSLLSIKLPIRMPALTTMYNCFAGCYSLQIVTLPEYIPKLTTLEGCFSVCYALKTVIFPETTPLLNSLAYTFQYCHSLKSIVLPENLDKVTTMANCFDACFSLQSVTMPISMTLLNTLYNTFNNCYTLQSIVLPATLDAVTTMATCFTSCYSLQSITMPISMTLLNTLYQTFTYCYSLQTLTLPTNLNKVTSLNATFYWCKSLQSIINLSTLGSTTAAVDAQNCFTGLLRYNTALVSNAGFIIFHCEGNINGVLPITSIRLTNPISTFSGAMPAIKISYCSLDTAALNLLFSDIANVNSITIDITGNPGTDVITKSSVGYTTGSNVFTTNTSGLEVGMEVNGIMNNSCTFTDAGDTVNHTSHGLSDGSIISFYNCLGTTGIALYTTYYIVNKTDNTFQISDTLGGSPKPLVGDGTGGYKFFAEIISIDPGVSITINKVFSTTGTLSNLTFGLLKRSILLHKNWTIIPN